MANLDFDPKRPHTTHYGIGPPSNDVGRNGDYYRDEKNNRLYGPKEGGQWPNGSVLLEGGDGSGSGGNTGSSGGGRQGPPGPGVPTGGAPGYYLVKRTSQDFDTEWRELGTDEDADWPFDSDIGFDSDILFDAGSPPLVIDHGNLTGLDDPNDHPWVAEADAVTLISAAAYTNQAKAEAIFTSAAYTNTQLDKYVRRYGLDADKGEAIDHLLEYYVATDSEMLYFSIGYAWLTLGSGSGGHTVQYPTWSATNEFDWSLGDLIVTTITEAGSVEPPINLPAAPAAPFLTLILVDDGGGHGVLFDTGAGGFTFPDNMVAGLGAKPGATYVLEFRWTGFGWQYTSSDIEVPPKPRVTLLKNLKRDQRPWPVFEYQSTSGPEFTARSGLGLASSYTVEIVKMSDKPGITPIDNYYLYTSTDHDCGHTGDTGAEDAHGGIWLLTGPTPAGPWTLYDGPVTVGATSCWGALSGRSKAIYQDPNHPAATDLTYSTETPCVVYDWDTNKFLMYYQVANSRSNPSVTARADQSTCLATSDDGLTWNPYQNPRLDGETRILDVPFDPRAAGATHDLNGHTGYFRAFRFGAGWIGYSLLAGGHNPDGAAAATVQFAVWYSTDGYYWQMDPRILTPGQYHIIHHEVGDERVAGMGWNGVQLFQYDGRIWALGAIQVGSGAAGALNLGTIISPMASDMRHVLGGALGGQTVEYSNARPAWETALVDAGYTGHGGGIYVEDNTIYSYATYGNNTHAGDWQTSLRIGTFS